jgi:hypothetical protein
MYAALWMISMVFALILVYIPVEKPALDARKAFSRV